MSRMDLIERGNQQRGEKGANRGERGRVNRADPWGVAPIQQLSPWESTLTLSGLSPALRTTISQLLWDSNDISLALIGL